MKLLFVYATSMERDSVEKAVRGLKLPNTVEIDHLVTGVGMVATSCALARWLAERPCDAVVNWGVAGAFQEHIPLGSALRIDRDCFSEMGAESPDGFLPIDRLGMGAGSGVEAISGWIHPTDHPLFDSIIGPRVSGITVNTVHGERASIRSVIQRLQPDAESMEGAAIFYVANQWGLPSAQIRTVSNRVDVRNRDRWEMGLALRQLGETAAAWIKTWNHGN